MWDFNSKQTYVFRTFYIPPRMMGGLQRYIENHIPPGEFLKAVIKNDLSAAVDRADEENLHNIPAYVGFLYNQAPSACWGSKENFEYWLSLAKDKEI